VPRRSTLASRNPQNERMVHLLVLKLISSLLGSR
jgi:hypothetical protein